ncbi:MAG: hypothetical protein JOZ73_10900 [Solirubrobacterales bacterium]|nr:hypothetical protein [Solirubrobacterales bacterium]
MRTAQAVLLVLGAVLAVALVDLMPTLAGVLLATILAACAAALAFAPIGKRTAEEWLPIVGSFGLRRTRRRTLFRSPLPVRGVLAQRPTKVTAPAPPPSVGAVKLIEVPYRDRPIGVLAERGGKRLTSVLACRVVAFSLLDPEAQERRLARWGLILSGAASSPIRRMQWIERTIPAQGDELARWLHAERDPSVPLRGTPLIESYLELIGTSARVTQEHEILLSIQLDTSRLRDRPAEELEDALIETTERIAEGLESAEVKVLGALSPGHLSRAMRTAFDPYARAELAALQIADPDRDGLSEANAWPLGGAEAWDHYRSDGAVHATYWIGGWPRVEVSPMFMEALLGRSSVVRTVAVTFEPIAPERSIREVEAAITRDRADRSLRQRLGQSETARQRQAQDSTMRREAELAAGHSEVRLAGFVTVSGRDGDELRRAGAEVLEQAARARLELHRMYGQQADAFTFTLPLCRGLR